MKRFWQVFEFVEDIVSGGLLFCGVSLIFYGVIMRYYFDAPKSWVDEVSQYLIIWGTLIGTSVALRNNHHIKVDMLFDRLPSRVQYYVTLFAHTVGIAFSLFITYYGFTLVQFTHRTGQRSTDVGIPLFIVYSILPLMGGLLTLRFTVKLYETARLNVKEWIAERAERMKSYDGSTAL
ncbi:MAG: TRAP transporter small permease [Desulfitobacterium hafniense]|nr:TRAP transporter small permease [Desulfitobacterium hafniense]